MKPFLRTVIWIIMLVPLIYLAVIWKKIPQTVPMHFDLKGAADSYGTKKAFLVLVASITGVNAIVYLILLNVYRIDPKRNAAENKERMQRIGFSTSLFFSAIFVMIIYEVSHNSTSITPKFIFIATGLLFSLLGNNMYNIKPNYFAGIRLPWTLENEDNWRKTHHLAGRLWFFGGLTFAFITLFLPDLWIMYVGAIVLAALVLIPVIYSYKLYRDQTRKI